MGFFFSRALLSISMMLFGLNGLLGIHPKHWLKEKWWLLGAAWVSMYLISGLWSHDMDYWYTRCEVKLPILLLPLAFAFTDPFSHRQQKAFTLVLNALLLCGVVYSFSFLVKDPVHYINGYDYSSVLPTIPKNDHIVFSMAMASAVVWNVYFHPFILERGWKILNVIMITILVISLHILAARTGLVALYVFAFVWLLFLIIRKKTRVIGIAMTTLVLVFAFLCLRYIPTLHNRLDHTNYTLKMFREGNISGDYSDLGRYMSYDIALRLIKAHPIKGTGAGDILDSMRGGYDRWFSNIPDKQRLIPHNQFLTVALGGGAIATLFFILWTIYPLFEMQRNRAGFFFLAMWSIMLVPLMVEPVLEIQFGVFVYLFFMLWQRHAMLGKAKPVLSNLRIQ